MNYCCALGNCAACKDRWKRIRAQNRVRRRRLRLYGPPPAPSKQNVLRDEIVKVYADPST